MKTVVLVVVVIVLVAIVGVGAYDLGMTAGETNAQNIRTQFFQSRPTTGQTSGTQQGQGQGQGQAASRAARPLATGAIQSLNGNIMEVTQQDGTTVTVVLSPQTVVEKTTTGAQSDLKPGLRVSVQGVQATGQVDAQLIQITQSTQ